MKYFYYFILLCFVLGNSRAQTNSQYSSESIRGLIVDDSQSSPYFLLKVDDASKQLRENEHYTVVKKLNNSYYIIKWKSDPLNVSRLQKKGTIWSVSNAWKESISLEGIDPNSRKQFVVKSDCNILLTNSKSIKIRKFVNYSNTYLVESSLSEIRNQLLDNECITYIGSESFSPKTEAIVNDLNLTYNRISTIHSRYPDINGEGIIISLKENQFNVDDIDLLGKNIPSGISSNSTDNHATEMATIIAGSGNSFVTGKGVANGAKLSSSDFFDIIPDTNEEYKQLSIDAQNHSYGTVIENFYGTLAEAYDVSSYNNPEILHVFSAGNVGLTTSTEGPYANIPQVANLTGNFKSSKNTISVGSVDEEGNLIGFSSRGPAFDGRIKPELVTYSKLGTSNSAATVSGLGALLNQKYREDFNDVPSAALLKAILITSATDVESKGIDYQTGFGNINGERAFENLANGQFQSGELANGEQFSFPLQIPANAKNLKVTLTWTDLAATAGSLDVLINDLDLKVTKDTEEWLPWVLNPNRDNLSDLPTRNADHLNVIEQVTIDELVSGTYNVVVDGFDIVSESQAFAIAYQYDLADEFSWSYPVKNDNLPYDGENAPYLQWNSTFDVLTRGSLHYTTDNGATWLPIADNVNLSKGFYQWSDFPTDFSISKIRMTVGTKEYLTDDFVISLPKRVSLGYECGDSLLFFWNKNEGVTSYNIFHLPDENLTLLKNTSDTSILINKNSFTNIFFAVEPVYTDEIKGMRSFTINYELQGGACYFNSIFPESVTTEDKILVRASIGTTFNIEKIVFERFNNKEFEEIGEIVPDQLEIEFDDLSPMQGINIYRAVAVLKSGQRVVSEESEIYYLTSVPVQVFPNPVKQSESLAIFTRDLHGGSAVFKLYNSSGQLVLTDLILTDREGISTTGLNRGLYFYKVTGAGINESGRIIIE